MKAIRVPVSYLRYPQPEVVYPHPHRDGKSMGRIVHSFSQDQLRYMRQFPLTVTGTCDRCGFELISAYRLGRRNPAGVEWVDYREPEEMAPVSEEEMVSWMREVAPERR